MPLQVSDELTNLQQGGELRPNSQPQKAPFVFSAISVAQLPNAVLSEQIQTLSFENDSNASLRLHAGIRL